MSITRENVDALNAIVHIELKKEEYEPKVSASLRKLGKQIAIKGFRPGMVPTPVVKKMYGTSVLAEEVNRALNDRMWKYLQEEKIEILGQPIPAKNQPMLNLDINNVQDIHFAYEVGLQPPFELTYLDKAPTFTRYNVTIPDKMVDDEIARIRKRFSTFEYPESVSANDILSFTIEELNDDGSVKEGGVSTVSTLMLDMIKEQYQGDFLAMKKQGSLRANVWEMIDRDREGIAKNVLNLTHIAKADTVGNNFLLTLNNITRAVPAELNEEFFKKVYGENGINNETDMRLSITADLQAYFDGQSDSYLINDLYKGIMQNMDFPLPDDFLKRWVKLANEKEVTDEQINEDYPRFSKQLRWQLITSKIIREQGYQVSADEIKERTRLTLIQQLYGYGMRNIGDEWIDGFVEKQLKDKEHVKRISDQILDDKVMTYIKSKVKLQDQSISFEDFKALVERGNE